MTYDIKKEISNNVFLPAPSDPPTSVTISDVTSSSITIQWGPVNCIHRNGHITGYIIQYEEKGSYHIKDISVTSSSTEATIFGVNSATNYSIEVVAVNSAGIGVYSSPEYVVTKGMVITLCLFKLNTTWCPCTICLRVITNRMTIEIYFCFSSYFVDFNFFILAILCQNVSQLSLTNKLCLR